MRDSRSLSEAARAGYWRRGFVGLAGGASNPVALLSRSARLPHQCTLGVAASLALDGQDDRAWTW
jgi:hypothetical protein